MPTDDITIYYEASGDLDRVCRELNEFIFETGKQPLVSPIPTSEPSDAVLLKEDNKVRILPYNRTPVPY